MAEDGDQEEGSCEHGGMPLGPTKCWETLEWLSD
jgi:hypothetical protein